MTIHLLCSIRGAKRKENRDSIFVDAQVRLREEFGDALGGMEFRRLDLVVAGRAFRDLTDIRALHISQRVMARQVVDIWWAAKDRTFQPGRGYPEWLWRSVYEWLRICGQGGRAWRLLLS